MFSAYEDDLENGELVQFVGLLKTDVATNLLQAPRWLNPALATERTFSIHGNIHSLKRNRLTTERAAKLAYISYNWNLLHNQKDEEVDEDEEEPISSPLMVSPSTIKILNLSHQLLEEILDK
ncbi:hypothetical protein HF086_005628 [Spodoptera exigua]|uniref:HAT C-terminal dimerisation domain-containing protein n=1 Tax=Spodoptera exigua TaxID=7107 RepID=A0A922MY45_SPOEX|nr:hypothetical protein HF086_005628 [Spodoptera exigua]